MASLVPLVVLLAFEVAVAVAIIALGLRNAIRASALGYSVVLLAGFLPLALRNGAAPSPADIVLMMVISLIFAMPGVFLSILGAALLFKLPAAQPLTRRVVSVAIGFVLGTLGGFVSWSFSSYVNRCGGPMVPWWGALILGAGAGACWGILAPSVIRPNKPLQPTSGGRAEGGCGSMGTAARG